MKKVLFLLLIVSAISIQAQKENVVIKENGYNLIVDTGIGLGKIPNTGLNILNGYRFNSYTSIHLGSGIKYDFGRQAYYPVFLDFRAYFTQHKSSPFINIDLGRAYNYNLDNHFSKKGNLFKIGIGVGKRKTNNKGIFLNLSYERQVRKAYGGRWYDGAYYSYRKKVDTPFHSIGLNIGYSF